MIIPEVIENLEFRYLYVKSFKWQESILNEQVQGHPQTGRIYRAMWNKQTKNYKIIIRDTQEVDSLVLETLSNTNPEYAYLSDIQELTVNNILDFKIEEEDLDRLNIWIETNNKDILDRFKPQEEGLIKLRQAINDQEDEEFEVISRASKVMLDLYHTNEVQFEILIRLAEYLTDQSFKEGNDPANYLTLHPAKGIGINVARSLRAIDKYISDDRRKNEDVDDLFDAMGGVVVEIERKIINGQID